ncbi:MAG: IPTL-CTERM sorting domain-containing protein [Thermoanaerobaculia bacterium]|nr:IPTL-CTERM sorting domain-containing protein [Thermoanaerobaculia bacterium]
MKKFSLLGAVMVLSLSASAFAADFGPSAIGPKVDHPVAAPDGGATSITQSLDTATITSLNSVACPADDDSYYRRFDLDGEFGIIGQYDISSVDIGVESNIGASLTVNLYTIPNADPLLVANLTPIGTALVSPLTAPDLSIANLPVAGSVLDPAAVDLVVEIVALDTTNAFTFFIGSNANGQTAPSYLRSVGCGAAEPTDTGTLGFPGMHILMVVNGDEIVGGPVVPVIEVPTLNKAALAGLALLLLAAGFVAVRRFN